VQQFACAPQETLCSVVHQAVSYQWETLSFKNRWPGFFNQSREGADWRFITDGPICFAADKGNICNVVSFPGRIAAFSNRLRKYMVEL
jgi:hypothetical protein